MLFIKAGLTFIVDRHFLFQCSDELDKNQCVDVTDEVQRILVDKGRAGTGDPINNCAVVMREALDLVSYYVQVDIMVVVPSGSKDHGHNTRPGIAYNAQNAHNYDVVYMK